MPILRFGVLLDIVEDLLKIVGELDVLWDNEARLNDSFQKVICLRKMLKFFELDGTLVRLGFQKLDQWLKSTVLVNTHPVEVRQDLVLQEPAPVLTVQCLEAPACP